MKGLLAEGGTAFALVGVELTPGELVPGGRVDLPWLVAGEGEEAALVQAAEDQGRYSSISRAGETSIASGTGSSPFRILAKVRASLIARS